MATPITWCADAGTFNGGQHMFRHSSSCQKVFRKHCSCVQAAKHSQRGCIYLLQVLLDSEGIDAYDQVGDAAREGGTTLLHSIESADAFHTCLGA